VALPLLAVWMGAPYLAERISQPRPEKIEQLDDEQWRELRTLARRTWLFFEEFVGPQDHWLPPDHYQRTPLGVTKHYTSPTNIGLMLLSTLAAYDLGYIGLLELTLRLNFAFDSVARLTLSRAPAQLAQHPNFNPSAALCFDGGQRQLRGCLLALKQGCRDLIDIPILRGRRWQGALDILDLLAEILARVESQAGPDQTHALRSSMQTIRQRIIHAQSAPLYWTEQLTALIETDWGQMSTDVIARVEAGQNIDAELLADLRIYLERLRSHLFGMQRDIELLLPWMILLTVPPPI
jgi:cyclic beta-1,2-glucan synthetase